jgi:inosine-uridine nucleoside N-ribohydrolase
VGVETPLTRLVKEKVEHFLKRFPDRPFRMLMYDQLAVAALVDPTLFKTEELYVDVDINHGINYGVSVGGKRLWPGAEGTQEIQVQYNVDWDRFIRMYVERVTGPVPGTD